MICILIYRLNFYMFIQFQNTSEYSLESSALHSYETYKMILKSVHLKFVCLQIINLLLNLKIY